MATIVTNNFDALNPEVWKPVVQDYLNKMLVVMDIGNVKCEQYLSSGDKVNFPFVADVRTQDYIPGTELDIDQYTATQNSLTVDQSKAATVYIDPQEEKQALANYGMELAYQSAFQLRNNIDQTGLASLTNNASFNVADSPTGDALSSSTILRKMTDARAQLGRNNAGDGEHFAVLDYERGALLEQALWGNGFQLADSTLRNGFAGNAVGFKVYMSNNLPSTQLLTIAANATAGDTFKVYGVEWTFVANGTAANPGEISLGTGGSALADTQVSVREAINGTGTPGASNYIDVSVHQRRTLQNARANASAFSANVTTITGFGKIGGTAVFTSGSNLFGTETSNLLFGRMGALSLGIQMYPELYVKEEPRMLGRNYITHTLYGVETFERDKQRVVRSAIQV
jgi:hypothetical protein